MRVTISRTHTLYCARKKLAVVRNVVGATWRLRWPNVNGTLELSSSDFARYDFNEVAVTLRKRGAN